MTRDIVVSWDQLLKAASAHWQVYHLIGWRNIPRPMQHDECVAMVRAFEAAGFEVAVPKEVDDD